MTNLITPTRLAAISLVALIMSGCAAIPASGPAARDINKVARSHSSADAGIAIVDVTDAVTRSILARNSQMTFSDSLGQGRSIGSVIGKGDILDISIWEAPPAALFGTIESNAQLALSGPTAELISSGSTAKGTSLPEQMVDNDGQITVPFAGRIQADGRTPQEIARAITVSLTGKAHQPQTIVRLVHNAAANVTVVGDVANSIRVPLTARGEKVLDVLATAGGVKQPVGKMTIQITRGTNVSSMPLAAVIRDPRQNVHLQPDDVMTLLFQPYSFTALGAVSRSEEIPFEATGMTLAQALGRVSGLEDTRANVKGVFIFRLEQPGTLPPQLLAGAKLTPDGKIPIIYRINMKDPSTLFIAQSFPIRDKDVLYVSNAPLADLQKFLGAIFSTVLPAATAASVATQY